MNFISLIRTFGSILALLEIITDDQDRDLYLDAYDQRHYNNNLKR